MAGFSCGGQRRFKCPAKEDVLPFPVCQSVPHREERMKGGWEERRRPGIRSSSSKREEAKRRR